MGLTSIRLMRVARTRNNPVYKIVVTDSRKRLTSGSFVEKIGMYNPIEKISDAQRDNRAEEGQKEMMIDFERAKYWLGRGAKPTDHVHRLFTYCGILPPHPRLIPKDWEQKKFQYSYAEAARYFKQKFKIENKSEF